MVDVAEALIELPRKLAHRTELADGEHDTLLGRALVAMIVHDGAADPVHEVGRAG